MADSSKKSKIPPPPPSAQDQCTDLREPTFEFSLPEGELASEQGLESSIGELSLSQLQGKRPSQLATYEDLFLRMRDPILILDQNSDEIVEVNDACEQVLGLDPDALIGQPIFKWITPDAREHFAKHLRVAKRRQMSKEAFDTHWKVIDGKPLTLEVYACRLRLANGTEVMQLVARDVTRIRMAEADLRTANKLLESLSITDELTEIFNFRHFSNELAREHERADRYETPYALIFCDVDHFKNYNDLNGHRAGDAVLKRLGQILQEQTRNTDIPARYGGEEFVVLCPGVDHKGASVLAERLRKTVEAEGFENEEQQPLGNLTISIGISSFPFDGQTRDEIIEAADRALYYSKENGRNCITTAHAQKNISKRVA